MSVCLGDGYIFDGDGVVQYRPPAGQATRSAKTPVSPGVYPTIIPFDTVFCEGGMMWDPASYEFILPIDGWYAYSAFVSFHQVPNQDAGLVRRNTGRRLLQVLMDGSVIKASRQRESSGVDDMSLLGAYDHAAGDRLCVNVYHDYSNEVDVYGIISNATLGVGAAGATFSCVWLGGFT